MINRDRLIKTFMDIVQIDSPSDHEKDFAQYCEKRLQTLGGKTSYDAHGNLFATFDGVGEPLILNAHLDTVEPGRGIKPSVTDGKIVSDGTTILGGDAKAGVAAIFETLESLKEDKATSVPLEIVLTLGEELGLVGAANLDYSKLQAQRAVTFDGEEKVANVTIGSPGYNQIFITITGRSAHAGVEPEKGISAIQIAGEIITRLKLGRIDEDTTANIGKIVGGSAINAVPEYTKLSGEIRSRRVEKLETHTQTFRDAVDAVSKNYPEAKIALEVNREFDPYTFDESNPTLKFVTEQLKKMNLTPNLHYSGGGTDVNMFHKNGIPAICVGAGTHNMHTKREFVDIEELVETAQFCEQLAKTS